MAAENEAKTCCFTGQRFINGADDLKARKVLAEILRDLIGRGYTHFWSGGAVGFDMLAAEVVIELKGFFPQIKLNMALPCRDQSKRWNKSDKRRYEEILAVADEIVYVCETYCTGCMHLRNRFLVEQSGICVAYKKDSDGGTAHTVSCARDKGIEVINIAYLI